MEVVKEGHLNLYMGKLLGWQRRYFIVDNTNDFLAYAPAKDQLFKGGANSETIPGCVIADSALIKGREFSVSLSNGRKLELRVERSDDPEVWVNHIFNLSSKAPSRASGGAVGPFGSVGTDAERFDDPSYPIKLTWEQDNKLITKEYHTLIVACDPRSLHGIMPMTALEEDIFLSLCNFTFHTTVVEVKAQDNAFRSRFSPSALDKMNGDLYGYRNESTKQFKDEAKSLEKHHIVTYQILSEGKDLSSLEMETVLVKQMATVKWFPYKEFRILDRFHSEYFAHYSNENLVRALPWKLLDIQGEKNTMYVHASACFDAIVHSWLYGGMILKHQKVNNALPMDKTRPIAIIGAGPTGLMMAVRLTRLGYSNIEFIESTDRFGGKTRSSYQETPLGRLTCEMGTCYLSPAYAPFRNEFDEFFPEDEEYALTTNLVYTEGQLTNPPAVINFADYVIAKAMEENDAKGFNVLTHVDILLDFQRYIDLHFCIMGTERPIPSRPPDSLLKGKLGQQTFRQFLEEYKLTSLVGMLQYAQSVQGYGAVNTIPAFYGLMWITPELVSDIMKDAVASTVGLEPEVIVSALKNGWQDVWNNVMEKMQFRINYNCKLKKISRAHFVEE